MSVYTVMTSCLHVVIVLLWTRRQFILGSIFWRKVTWSKGSVSFSLGILSGSQSVRSCRRGPVWGNSFPQVHQGERDRCQAYWSALLSHLYPDIHAGDFISIANKKNAVCCFEEQLNQTCWRFQYLLTHLMNLFQRVFVLFFNQSVKRNSWNHITTCYSVCVIEWWMIPAGTQSRQEDSQSRWVNIL